jgi:hypothetical protein
VKAGLSQERRGESKNNKRRTYNMGSGDNILNNRGTGNWEIYTYNPNQSIGIFEGVLVVGKDFHAVFADESMTVCLVNVASQNVAYVINKMQ